MPNAIVMSDGPSGEISSGGTKLTNFSEIDAYNRTAAWRNQCGAWISAAAALFSGAAIVVDKWPSFFLP